MELCALRAVSCSQKILAREIKGARSSDFTEGKNKKQFGFNLHLQI